MNMMKAKIKFTMKPMVIFANNPLDLLLEIFTGKGRVIKNC